MDNVKKEYHTFPETVKKNVSIYKSFWTSTMPRAYPPIFQESGKYEWHPQENKHQIIEEYKDTRIEYSIDEYGFREYPSQQKNNLKKIFCFGCDLTFGKGLPDEYTWPYLLADMLGQEYEAKNYGVTKCSFEYNVMCYYQLMKSLPKEKYPSAVFFFVPNPFRAFYIGNKRNKSPLIFHVHNNIDSTSTYEKELEKVQQGDEESEKNVNYYSYMSSTYAFIEIIKYFNFIDQISKNRSIPWFWYSSNSFFKHIPENAIQQYFPLMNYPNQDGKMIFLEKWQDYNRDGKSWGKETNGKIANYFKYLYEKHLSGAH